MRITNKTTKIIGIGGVAVLPDESITVDAAGAGASIIQHLAATGKISIEEDKTKAGGSSAEPSADAPAAGSDSGDSGKKKPVSRMSKDELVEECLKLGLDILEDDTRETLVEKIKAATAG